MPPVADEAEGRTRSLAASVAYSYAHLAPATRRLLPAMACALQDALALAEQVAMSLA